MVRSMAMEPQPEPQQLLAPADWSVVPDDVLAHVLDRLSFADVAACGSVCASWRGASRSDWVWSRRCGRRWCLNALAHFETDSPIRRGWESGLEGAALVERLRRLGLTDERELAQAVETIAQIRQRGAVHCDASGDASGDADDAAASAADSGGLWWSLFREIETKPLSTSWLQVGDHVDCRWGEEDNSVYQIPRLRGALQAGQSAAHWEARVLEFGSQEGWLLVHYVGYAESSPWAKEWVGRGKVRATGRVNWDAIVSAGDEVEVLVTPPSKLHDRMRWPATVVAVKDPDGNIDGVLAAAALEPEPQPEPEPEVEAGTDSPEEDTRQQEEQEEEQEEQGGEEYPPLGDSTASSEDEAEDVREEEEDEEEEGQRLEPPAALLDQAPEQWMRGSSQIDRLFLVRYPALNGLGDEDAAMQGGHEWVRRDQIYPLRAAADTSGS